MALQESNKINTIHTSLSLDTIPMLCKFDLRWLYLKRLFVCMRKHLGYHSRRFRTGVEKVECVHDEI